MADELKPTRSDTWEWSVFIDTILGGNLENWGVWDQKEGGDVSANVQQYRPGGMSDPIVIGGSRTTSNVTLRRNYRLGRDHAKSQRLINSVGRADVRLVGQPLDTNKNPFGEPLAYRGKLMRAQFPNHDSMSEDPGMLEIECAIEGFPTGMG